MYSCVYYGWRDTHLNNLEIICGHDLEPAVAAPASLTLSTQEPIYKKPSRSIYLMLALAIKQEAEGAAAMALDTTATTSDDEVLTRSLTMKQVGTAYRLCWHIPAHRHVSISEGSCDPRVANFLVALKHACPGTVTHIDILLDGFTWPPEKDVLRVETLTLPGIGDMTELDPESNEFEEGLRSIAGTVDWHSGWRHGCQYRTITPLFHEAIWPHVPYLERVNIRLRGLGDRKLMELGGPYTSYCLNENAYVANLTAVGNDLKRLDLVVRPLLYRMTATPELMRAYHSDRRINIVMDVLCPITLSIPARLCNQRALSL